MNATHAVSQRGSATLELVIATPLLIALMLFVAYGGRLVQARGDVDAAARDAARAASLTRSSAAAETAARQAATAALQVRQAPCLHTAVSTAVGGLQRGGTVAVTVTCQVALGDLSLLAVPGSRTVTAHASAPVDVYRSDP